MAVVYSTGAKTVPLTWGILVKWIGVNTVYVVSFFTPQSIHFVKNSIHQSCKIYILQWQFFSTFSVKSNFCFFSVVYIGKVGYIFVVEILDKMTIT